MKNVKTAEEEVVREERRKNVKKKLRKYTGNQIERGGGELERGRGNQKV